MAPLLWLFVPDSVSWLVAENRLDEAAQIVLKAAKMNGKQAREFRLMGQGIDWLVWRV